jgi:hypothetical protein
VPYISNRIFLPGQQQQQGQEELSLPVLQAANASREPHVYLFIYCISKAISSKKFFFFFLCGKNYYF